MFACTRDGVLGVALGWRLQLHERDHVRKAWVPPGKKEITVERKLQASQIALRMMDNPIEYTNPHAHKIRA